MEGSLWWRFLFLNKIRLLLGCFCFCFLAGHTLELYITVYHTILVKHFARLSQLLRNIENARNGSWALAYFCLHPSVMLQDTGGTGDGRKGEEDVVSVTISWLKNLVQAVVQETPAEADFPSEEHCELFALPGCCLVLHSLSSLLLCLEESWKKYVFARGEIFWLCKMRTAPLGEINNFLKASIFQASNQIHFCSAILT